MECSADSSIEFLARIKAEGPVFRPIYLGTGATIDVNGIEANGSRRMGPLCLQE